MQTTIDPATGQYIHTFTGEEVADALKLIVASDPPFWQHVMRRNVRPGKSSPLADGLDDLQNVQPDYFDEWQAIHGL